MEADRESYDWLLERSRGKVGRAYIAIGFNVAGFDMPFFKEQLPLTTSLLVRKSIDLNALCATLADDTRSFNYWREAVKDAGRQWAGSGGAAAKEHDAGWDAAVALGGWLWLKSELNSSK